MEIPTPFPRMTYREAMNRYGSRQARHAFRRRAGRLRDIFRESQFKVFRSIADSGGVIKAINAKGAATLLSKEQLKKWEEWVKTELGAKGLAYIRLEEAANGSRRSSNSSASRKRPRSPQRMDFQEGDVLFFGADKWEARVRDAGPRPAARGGAARD